MIALRVFGEIGMCQQYCKRRIAEWQNIKRNQWLLKHGNITNLFCCPQWIEDAIKKQIIKKKTECKTKHGS